MKHVHSFERPDRMSKTVRCVVCGIERKVEELVYLGDAPRSVGRGTTSTVGVR